MAIIGIVLGVVAIGLFIWLRKEQQMDNGLHAAELDHTHHGMNAMMDNFNNYQVKTDRKIAELEKQISIKERSTLREVDKMKERYPNCALYVVYGIRLDKSKIKPIASLGKIKKKYPWQIKENKLRAKDYYYDF